MQGMGQGIEVWAKVAMPVSEGVWGVAAEGLNVDGFGRIVDLDFVG